MKKNENDVRILAEEIIRVSARLLAVSLVYETMKIVKESGGLFPSAEPETHPQDASAD